MERLDVGVETEAYAAYLNAGFASDLEEDEHALFVEDKAKAKAQMERAWLEAKPTAGEGE